MIVLLYGQNTMAIRRRMQALKDEADGGSGMLTTNYLTVDGRDARPADILGPAMSPPFLAPKRLVVVENFFERYQGGGRDGRSPRSLEPLKPLFEVLEDGIPESTILVFLAPGKVERNALLDRLRKLPGVQDEHQPEVSVKELPRYIQDEASARGIKFRQGAPKQPHPGSEEWLRGAIGDPVAILMALCKSDTLAIANELDKLALYTQDRGGVATVDDVYEACAGAREAGQWALRDALLDGDLDRALDTLLLLRADPNYNTQILLGQVASVYRSTMPIVELASNGASTEEMAKAMGNAGNYQKIRDTNIRRAKRLGPDGLRHAFAAIVEADRTNKLGEVDEDVAVEIMIGKLASLV